MRITVRRFWWLAILLAVVPAAWLLYYRSPSRGLPYKDAFAKGSSDEWTAYGGTWRVLDGAMRNESDERGAKLMTGSPWWKDYSVTSDIELLGQQGDAGILLRASQEEQGVDAYNGYYVGLRSNDGSLIIGLAQYGWLQLAGTPMPGGVHPYHWYRLRATVTGCRISAVAVDPATASVTSLSADDEEHCLGRGRIGIRSHSSGGVWKHIVVEKTRGPMPRPLNAKSQSGQIARIPYAVDEPVQSRNENHAASATTPDAFPRPETVATLKQNRRDGRPGLLRGTVVLTAPRLFVQDPTGGAAVTGPSIPDLKVGDEVEVRGATHLGGYHLSLSDASVRLLWARAPLPPLAITADQAATGAYDSTYVEVIGALTQRSADANGSLQLDFTSGDQSFRALVSPGRDRASLRHVALQSRLRVRGICVADPAFTRNQYPFVLLVPSADDVEVLAGPPWWSARSLALFAFGATTLLLLTLLLYMRIDHWRMQAVLRERERIAHEMHDSLAQSFVGIGFQLQAIGNGVKRQSPEVHRQVAIAEELVRHSHEEARRSLMTLRHDFLESDQLHTALERFASHMVESGAVTVEASGSAAEQGLTLAVKDSLFRIGQEAIANALRHAAPATITIRTESQPTGITMTIADDGVGFTPDLLTRGFGLQGIRKRADSIHASVNVESAPGRGTRITVTAPLPKRRRLSWISGRMNTYRGEPKP